jgi:phosphoglycolate phosphatase
LSVTPKRAVLFDLDGTLLDTLTDLGESMNAALVEVDAPEHPLDAYRRFVGDGMRNLALRALPPGHRDPHTLERCLAAMARIYQRRCALATRPYNGVSELLAELEHRRVPIAVLSNKPDDLTRHLIARFFGDRRFAAVIGAQPGMRRKPDPQAALEIAERFALPPVRILYLGDTDTDMRTAVAAGMVPVGALWGFRDAEELRASGAQALVAAPADVLPLLA